MKYRWDLTPLVSWLVIIGSLAWLVILVGGAVLILREVFDG